MSSASVSRKSASSSRRRTRGAILAANENMRNVGHVPSLSRSARRSHLDRPGGSASAARQALRGRSDRDLLSWSVVESWSAWKPQGDAPDNSDDAPANHVPEATFSRHDFRHMAPRAQRGYGKAMTSRSLLRAAGL